MREITQIFSKLIGIIVAVAWLTGVQSCTDSLPEPDIPATNGDGTITLTGTVKLPLMSEFRSRGTFGDTPGSGLQLTVLEFDYVSGNSAGSFLTNVYKATIEGITAVGNEEEVKFKLTLKSATTAKVLHFVMADNFSMPSGFSEAAIIPNIVVDQKREAYWGSEVFTNGYNTLDNSGNPVLLDNVKSRLGNLHLIRNFSKISVTSEVSTDKFTLEGFALVNIPQSGSVAPWNRSTSSTPALLDNSYKMTAYEDLDYRGFLPAGVTFGNTEQEIKSFVGGFEMSSDAQLLYEHPYESTRRTYLLVKGTYHYAATSTTGYYKIDIGEADHQGNFTNYNIIRNIHYNVVIKTVNAPGESTISAALDGIPFNNISASTETSGMLSISDGDNLLITNGVSHIIIDNSKPVVFKYRYVQKVSTTDKEENNEAPGLRVIGLEGGDVIERVVEKGIVQDGDVSWVTYEIWTYPPTNQVKTQDFVVIDGTGLGRTIHLILRAPWPYAPIYRENGTDFFATVAPGSDNLYDAADPQPKPVSRESGEPLTVYFNLPNGMPQGMFPLQFQLESKYQWIENNKNGDLVVTFGPSIFDPDYTAISFVKTVTYEEYMHLYSETDPNTIDVNTTNENHTIRCRFLTIAETEAGSEAQIRIHSDYFNPDAVVSFIRQ